MGLLLIDPTMAINHRDAMQTMRATAPQNLEISVWPDCPDPSEIRYVLTWAAPPGVIASFPKLELIISIGAGVDHLLSDPSLPDVPITRFVDPDLTRRMSEYVVLQTLTHHRRMTEFRANQQRGIWNPLLEPNASQLRIGVMGLGELGQAALHALQPFGYQLSGWSRSPKTISGVTTYAGPSNLDAFLNQTDILICLLPLTKETERILDARLIGKLGRGCKLPGPVLINAGRGALQIEADILTALQSGVLYGASLDVFASEPLASSSQLWAHPRAIITPHIAAISDTTAIAHYAIAQINAHQSGQKLDHLVDRNRGY